MFYLGRVGRGDAVGEGVGAEVTVGHFAAGVLWVLDHHTALGHAGHAGTSATIKSVQVKFKSAAHAVISIFFLKVKLS